MDKYLKTAKCMEAEVFKYHNDKTGWIRMKDYSGVEVWYKKSPHFSGNIYRFEYEVDLPSEKVFEVMIPPVDAKERLAWDNSAKDYICLEDINQEMRVVVFITKPAAGGLVASREFVDLLYFRHNIPSQDKIETIDHPKRPVHKSFVRGNNFASGYSVAKLKSDPLKSRMIMYVNCSPGGMIPQYLVEKALPSVQVTYMKSVEKEVKKRMGK